VAATTGYQTRIFEETARSIGFEVVMATDRCLHMEDPWGDGAIPVRFHKPEDGALTLVSTAELPDGILAVGDKPTVLAAVTAGNLGLRFHPRHAVEACRNKFLARERFLAAGMPVPYYYRVSLDTDIAEAARCAEFPCVLKPLGLSASRGVIRANDGYEFTLAFERIRSILQQPEIARLREEQDQFLQIESYIPGREFAVEGLVIDGALKVLAIFDKPDPLEGPYFEESLYVTPSREPAEVQNELARRAQQAVTAVGLTNGPVHAEMRHNADGVWMLEIAGRPIGGLCARSLRFGKGMPLEELLLRFAVGEDVSTLEREPAASGVMMIPIPVAGVYHDVTGVPEASDVPGITDIVITAKYGQRLQMLPEGSSYLGFIFARAEKPEEVEAALRLAHSRLRFEIMAELPTLDNLRANY
jgi:biotin carboxylase